MYATWLSFELKYRDAKLQKSIPTFRWSFGVLLYEMFTVGGTPYHDLQVQQVIQFVTDGNRMTKSRDIPHSIYDIMLRCWDDNAKDRPTFVELQNIMAGFLEVADNVSFNL